jgi:anti-anti-sigma factor
MELETKREEVFTTLRLQGSLDSKNSGDLYNYIHKLTLDGAFLFLLDMKKLRSISSYGFSTIIRLDKELKEKNAYMALSQPNEEIMLLLQFLGLDKRLKITSTEEESRVYLTSLSKLRKPPEPKESNTLSFAKPNKPIQFYFQGKKSLPESKIEFLGSKLGEAIQKSKIQEKEFSLPMPNPPSTSLEPLAKELNRGLKSLEEKIEELKRSLAVPNHPQPTPSINPSQRIPVVDPIYKYTMPPKEEIKKKFRTGIENSSSDLREVDLSQNIPDPLDDPEESILESSSYSTFSQNAIQSRPFEFQPKSIECEVCGSEEKINQPGYHNCSQCNAKFQMGNNGNVHYLEKL